MLIGRVPALCHKMVLTLTLLMWRIGLTFICPWIASISLKYNQQHATFSRSVYFHKLLYMFQAVSPPIIRSTKLYIQRQVLSDQYCCLLLSWMRWNGSSISSKIAAGSSIGLTIPDAVCTVLCSWWWAEKPPETCRVIYGNKQIEKGLHLVGRTLEIEWRIGGAPNNTSKWQMICNSSFEG